MTVLDGKRLAGEVHQRVQKEVEELEARTGKAPGLTVVIVGSDPASQIYVKGKNKTAAKLGIKSDVLELDASISAQELLDTITRLNNDDSVHGILVQMPLPDHLDEWQILDHIDPAKDVDRFHPVNLGMLTLKRTDIFPCTPAGILELLDDYKIDLTGMHAVVLGRSFIVGKPIAGMLTNRNATVTLCHSRTKDLPSILKQADLIVAAIGKPGYVTPDMVKDGAVLVDVGINRLDKKEDVSALCNESQIKRFEKKGYGITGDIHKDAFAKSSFYTPVPGGIGAMTVAMLMHNTVRLFKNQLKLD